MLNPQKLSNLEYKLLILSIYILQTFIIRVLCYALSVVMFDDQWLKLPSHVVVAWRHLNKAGMIWFALLGIQDLRLYAWTPLFSVYL